jgi:hypothetical protein
MRAEQIPRPTCPVCGSQDHEVGTFAGYRTVRCPKMPHGQIVTMENQTDSAIWGPLLEAAIVANGRP